MAVASALASASPGPFSGFVHGLELTGWVFKTLEAVIGQMTKHACLVKGCWVRKPTASAYFVDLT